MALTGNKATAAAGPAVLMGSLVWGPGGFGGLWAGTQRKTSVNLPDSCTVRMSRS